MLRCSPAERRLPAAFPEGRPDPGGAAPPAGRAELRPPPLPALEAEQPALSGRAGGGVFFFSAASGLSWSCRSGGAILCAICLKTPCGFWLCATATVCVCGFCRLSAPFQVSFSSSFYSSCTPCASCGTACASRTQPWRSRNTPFGPMQRNTGHHPAHGALILA
ncbi:hypothetical protein D3C75_781220 [compost metagenome]